MKYNEFKEIVKENARKHKIDEYELYYSRGASSTYSAYKGAIDTISCSDGDGVCFRCMVNGRMGYASTELFSVEEAERIVNDARRCAEILEGDDKEFLFDASAEYPDISRPCDAPTDAGELERKAIELEKKCYASDSRIKTVSHCTVIEEQSEIGITNSHGLDLYSKRNMHCAFSQVAAEENGDIRVGFSASFGNKADDVDIDFVAAESTAQAVGALGALCVPTGRYKTVISNMQMAALLQTFSDVFSAECAQKGLSLLAGRENEKIASEVVTIIDDPFCEASCCISAFDAEGVATYKKDVVKSGVFKTLLYNLKTADKAGCKTTGNAYKASYKSKVSTAPFAFYIEPSQISLDEIIARTENGIYITDLNGMHAGANYVTGDFSLSASGFLIESGKLSRPVKEFTLAGNFFSMLKQTQYVGNDLRFSIPDGNSQFGSPCAAVGEMSISGE